MDRKRKFVKFHFVVLSRTEVIELPLRYDKRIGTVTQQAQWIAQNIADSEGAEAGYRVEGTTSWISVKPVQHKLIEED